MRWKKGLQKITDFPVYCLAAAALALLRRLPRKTAYGFCERVAAAALPLLSKPRRIMRTNIGIAFPHSTPDQSQAMARNTLANLGKVAVELSRVQELQGKTAADLRHVFDISPEVQRTIRQLLERGKGLLYLTGHFGVWELLPSAHAAAFPDVPLSIVVRPLDNPWLDKMINRRRSLLGNRMLPRKNSIREIFAALHRNEAMGILLDQNVCREEGVFVDLFGKPACTNFGLAAVALKTGSPVLPVGLFYDAEAGVHRVHLEPEIPLQRTGSKAGDLRVNTQAYTRALEGMTRKFPDQWLWAHCRWKTRPKESSEKVYA